jgi:hypothetical protein
MTDLDANRLSSVSAGRAFALLVFGLTTEFLESYSAVRTAATLRRKRGCHFYSSKIHPQRMPLQ